MDRIKALPSNERGNGHGNGNGSRGAELAVRRADALLPEARPPHLGEIARDVMDHAEVIARDSIALGRLEAERVYDKARHGAREAIAEAKVEAADILPRVAFGAVAATLGAVGSVFACIAAFLGLGYVIPSLAARFAVFAVAFLLIGAAFAAIAGKKRRVPPPPRGVGPARRSDALRHIAPIHPLEGVGS